MVERQDRPEGLELPSYSFPPPHNGSSTSLHLHDLPSPRTGEVPPALSPLDALAHQGRLLARKFEQEAKNGRRISRLAPLTVQNEFGTRTGYFSSLTNSAVATPEDEPAPTSPPKLQPVAPEQSSADKHRSVYPTFGCDERESLIEPTYAYRSNLAPIGEQPTHEPKGYFDLPRTHSPELHDPLIGVQEATPISPTNTRYPIDDSRPIPVRQSSHDVLTPGQHSRPGLRPPRSPASQRSYGHSPSIRSVPGDGSEDVEDLSLAASIDSLQVRNISPSSSLSRSHSPFTPLSNPSIPRSPSLSSEFSIGGHPLPRPAFNFSRPLSSASRPSIDIRPSFETRPSIDVPSRKASNESAFTRPSFDSYGRQNSFESSGARHTNDLVHTPVSMTSEEWRRSTDYSNPTTSYTYAKFTLPRGRPLDRTSVGAEDFLNSQITWDQPNKPSDQQSRDQPPSSDSPPHSFDRSRPSLDLASRATSMDRGAPSHSSSNGTVRASTSTEQITAQEHCDKGIALHEAGEFMKSTYHFRLAARAGLPEAMFWYGLACRHGWGMKENRMEAFNWLRRAVDSGHLEVAEDETHSTDAVTKKQHKAQYAVAIYELGKCYMNGWGASQDKARALRCYEIAGNWGDADALVEAGYSYAEGVGCKKDMKKAAQYYRSAEAKGVSMVGNSWIYKDKYMDDGSAVSDARSVRSARSTKKDDASSNKKRDKSRTRTIFGRKKIPGI